MNTPSGNGSTSIDGPSRPPCRPAKNRSANVRDPDTTCRHKANSGLTFHPQVPCTLHLPNLAFHARLTELALQAGNTSASTESLCPLCPLCFKKRIPRHSRQPLAPSPLLIRQFVNQLIQTTNPLRERCRFQRNPCPAITDSPSLHCPFVDSCHCRAMRCWSLTPQTAVAGRCWRVG